jgi:hypothetical protein
VASYERQQIDSFSTWHTGTGVDINSGTGDIFAIHNGGLFRFQNKNGTYVKLPAIAPLQTRLGSACVSVNENTGELAVIHQNGLDVYQPDGAGYKRKELEVFHGLKANGRCCFHRKSGDIYVVSDTDGLSIWRKTQDSYVKQQIDNLGSWHSNCGLGLNQNNGDIFAVATHVAGGPGPYPVKGIINASDNWPKGDCLSRYRPSENNTYAKSIVYWPESTIGGADIDVNSETGEVVVIADPGLNTFMPADEKYVKNTISTLFTRGEGAAVKINEKTGEIFLVADNHVRVVDKTNSIPVDVAMTRSCGVDIAVNAKTGEIIMADNRGLTVYKKA